MEFFCNNDHLPKRMRGGFTIVEMLAVISIIGLLMAFVMPALQGIGSSRNITNAAYDVAGVLENARSYATSNNTYVWVGFFEEDGAKASTFPATAGTGRIVLSIVASRDGTIIYSKPQSPAVNIDPSRLVQINKLAKINNAHLKTAPSKNDPVFPIGAGTGDVFDTRPKVSGLTAQVGDVSPANSLTPFQYPVGGPASAQYVFKKVIQFSPRGETEVNNTNYSIKPIVEIGLQPARGNVVFTTSKNVAAVQITGIAGNVKIFRR